MSQNIKPGLGYIYGKEVVESSGAVTGAEISDTRQKYEVVAIGGITLDDQLKAARVYALSTRPSAESTFKVGDIVLIQKHAAEGDTPPNMLEGGYALFLASRVMAVIEGDK